MPYGLAATNRILSYSRGLLSNGFNIDIYIPIPTSRPEEIVQRNSDNIDGIKYIYTIGRYSNKYKIFRAVSVISGYRLIKGFFATLYKLYANNKKNRYDLLIISNDELLYLFVYSWFSLALKIKSVFIFDEYPVPIRHKLKNKVPLWKEKIYKYALRNINAYISISDELSNYYNKICCKKTFVMPVITDITRYSCDSKLNNDKEKYICYMGNMELSKDNVDLIIKAFSIVIKKYSNINLHLYGQPSIKNKKYLINIINVLGIEDYVKFKGVVRNTDVPQILMNSYILVSSQPKTVRAQGGFPTKLGEYLSSGVPTIISNVGENAKHVKNNEHVFLVEPDNCSEYAKKIEYIIENYGKAKIISNQGRKYVFENYSNIVVCKKLAFFLRNI